MCGVDEEFLRRISLSLQKQCLKVATAESCTGGLIAKLLTDISGSSNYFERGFITYSNISKISLLNVPEESIEKFGAVSKEVAVAMAEGVRTRSNVDIGIASTGIAGPTGGTDEKPVGLVYVAISTSENTNIKEFHFKGDRLKIRESASEAALRMLLSVLEGSDGDNSC
jgi:PncC family amidohydrolase